MSRFIFISFICRNNVTIMEPLSTKTVVISLTIAFLYVYCILYDLATTFCIAGVETESRDLVEMAFGRHCFLGHSH